MTALGYACVFVWLTTTPAGSAAIHGGKVIRRGHQRFYETQLFNFHWVYHGSGSEKTKEYVEKINQMHAIVWKRTPGAFTQAWDAQSAIILLSSYESLLRKMFGTKNDIHPQLKKAWPEWGERLTAWFKAEPVDGVPQTFGINYPRNWDEIVQFGQWLIDFDMDKQRSEEDRIKGHETAEAFIHQFSDLWFPRLVKAIVLAFYSSSFFFSIFCLFKKKRSLQKYRCLQFLGRAVVLTCLPKKIRVKQQLGDPNPILEFCIRHAFRLGMNYGDSLPDPVMAEFEDFYHELEQQDMSQIDAINAASRDAQDLFIKRTVLFGVFFVVSVVLALRYGASK